MLLFMIIISYHLAHYIYGGPFHCILFGSVSARHASIYYVTVSFCQSPLLQAQLAVRVEALGQYVQLYMDSLAYGP
jgi:hypothetical protein